MWGRERERGCIRKRKTANRKQNDRLMQNSRAEQRGCRETETQTSKGRQGHYKLRIDRMTDRKANRDTVFQREADRQQGRGAQISREKQINIPNRHNSRRN